MAARSEDSFYSLETRSQTSQYHSTDLLHVHSSQASFDTSDPSSLALIVSAKLERDDIAIDDIAQILTQFKQVQHRAKAVAMLHALCRKHAVLASDIAPAFQTASPALQQLVQLTMAIQDSLSDLNSKKDWTLVVDTDLKMSYR
jgi:hypothetical protein